MAGEWIKMRTNLWDDPRVSRLCDLTGCTEAAVIGGLYWLWATADTHSADGVMPGLTVSTVTRKTGVANFGAALAQIGWIEEIEDGIRIVKFDDHNGASAKSRAQTAKRVASHRSSADVTHNALHEDDYAVTGALAREEREEELPNTSANAEVAIGDADSPSGERFPDCPHKVLIELYAKHLPELPYPRSWDGQRANAMRSRWRWVLMAKRRDGQRYATDEASAVAWFDKFFAYVAKSDFLTGRNGKWDTCDLGWLMKAENFNKVLQGNYENKGSK